MKHEIPNITSIREPMDELTQKNVTGKWEEKTIEVEGIYNPKEIQVSFTREDNTVWISINEQYAGSFEFEHFKSRMIEFLNLPIEIKMTKSELRLGSLYQFNNDSSGDGFDNPGIDTLDISHFWTAHEYSFDITMYVEGIPLTEEWLIKFGFDKFEGYDFDPKNFNLVTVYIKDNHCIMLSGGKYWYVVREYDGGTSDPYQPVIEITSVHQLQNLFYVLTGEELTIKA